MDYKKMIEDAKRQGKATESVMWASIDSVSELLDDIRLEHPDKYWAFLRHAHEDIYGGHYDEEFARFDIEKMHSTDAQGLKHVGAHWTKAEVVTAMQGKVIPSDITDCDKWVAANAMWHDLRKVLNDSQIINVAVLFFFQDEDWGNHTKIWDYMQCK